MRSLLKFLYTYRALAVFLLLELASATLALNHQRYQVPYFVAIEYLINFASELKNYPFLKAENKKLLRDNAALRTQLLQEKEAAAQLYAPASSLIAARVVNNSIVGTKNYLTLNKGRLDGVASGMGVISVKGIVGKVKAVSDRFAIVMSLLHTSMQVSAKLEKSGVLCTIRWPGKDPLTAQLLYVPRHINLEIGDKIITSGYNTVFLEGTEVGHIKQVRLRKEAHFYDVELTLSTDLSALQHAYIVNNTMKPEKDTLEKHAKKLYE